MQTLMEILTEMITLIFDYQITPDIKLVKNLKKMNTSMLEGVGISFEQYYFAVHS